MHLNNDENTDTVIIIVIIVNASKCLKYFQILMRNLATEDVYLFTYENWLSKTKGPKRTKVCELAAVVDEEEMVEKTTYIIQVQTSDVGGGSCDFSVQSES